MSRAGMWGITKLGDREERKLMSGEGLGGRRGDARLSGSSNIKEIGAERPIEIVEVLLQMTTIVDLLRASDLPQFGRLAPSLLPKQDRVRVGHRTSTGAVAAIRVSLNYDDGLELGATATFENGRPCLQRFDIAWFSREDESSVVELNSAWIADLLTASRSLDKEAARRVCNEVLVVRKLPAEIVRERKRYKQWTHSR